MTLNANKAAGGGRPQADILEVANYPGRVVQVIDLGVQEQRAWEGKQKPPVNEIMVTYELGTEFLKDDEGNDDPEKPRWISERFPLFSLKADRAKSTARYMALDPKLELGGDWTQVPGTPCLIAVVNNTSKANGKTYNNVGGISAPIKGMPVPELVNGTKVFTMDDPDIEVFDSLPEWIQDIIKSGVEYEGSNLAAILAGGNEGGEGGVDQGGEAGPVAGEQVVEDADVPF